MSYTLPVEVALLAGASKGLSEYLCCEIHDGYIEDEYGHIHDSPYDNVLLFHDGRNGNTVSVIPFDDRMNVGITDATFDFYSYILPALIVDVTEYVRREPSWANVIRFFLRLLIAYRVEVWAK